MAVEGAGLHPTRRRLFDAQHSAEAQQRRAISSSTRDMAVEEHAHFDELIFQPVFAVDVTLRLSLPCQSPDRMPRL